MVFVELKVVYLFSWIIGRLAYLRRAKRFSVKSLAFAILLVLYGTAGIELGKKSESINLALVNYDTFIPPPDISILILSLGLALLIQQLITLNPKKHWLVHIESMGAKLAAFSYTLYLTHAPVLHLMRHFGLQRAPNINLISISIYLAIVSFCIIFSMFFYWMFESRTNDMKLWIKKRKYFVFSSLERPIPLD